MTASPLFDTTVSGRVTAANDKGIRLDVSDGWLNVSKFAVGVVLPAKGEAVSVTLDKAGFIRAVAPADGAGKLALSERSESNGAPVRGGSTGPTAKDTTITRLAVLKAAAEFSASKASSSSADVLKIAEAWERWVLRTDIAAAVVPADTIGDELDPFDSPARSGQAKAF